MGSLCGAGKVVDSKDSKGALIKKEISFENVHNLTVGTRASALGQTEGLELPEDV